MGGETIDPSVVAGWGMAVGAVLHDVVGDDLEDLMITSRRSYRLLRVLGSGARNPLLVHLCLDRERSNLALARRELASVRIDDLVPDVPLPDQGLPPGKMAAGVPLGPAGAPAVPLPRRAPVRRPPTALPAPALDEAPAVPAPALAPVLTQRWSTDRATLRRLLDALRATS